MNQRGFRLSPAPRERVGRDIFSAIDRVRFGLLKGALCRCFVIPLARRFVYLFSRSRVAFIVQQYVAAAARSNFHSTHPTWSRSDSR